MSTNWKDVVIGAGKEDAGFASVETHRLEHDIMNLYFVCRGD